MEIFLILYFIQSIIYFHYTLRTVKVTIKMLEQFPLAILFVVLFHPIIYLLYIIVTLYKEIIKENLNLKIFRCIAKTICLLFELICNDIEEIIIIFKEVFLLCKKPLMKK